MRFFELLFDLIPFVRMGFLSLLPLVLCLFVFVFVTGTNSLLFCDCIQLQWEMIRGYMHG